MKTRVDPKKTTGVCYLNHEKSEGIERRRMLCFFCTLCNHSFSSGINSCWCLHRSGYYSLVTSHKCYDMDLHDVAMTNSASGKRNYVNVRIFVTVMCSEFYLGHFSWAAFAFWRHFRAWWIVSLSRSRLAANESEEMTTTTWTIQTLHFKNLSLLSAGLLCPTGLWISCWIKYI